MPAKILEFTKGADGYRVRVHLDPDQVDEAGNPHPNWVHEWTYGLPQPSIPLHKRGGHGPDGAFLYAAHTQHGKNLTEDEYMDNLLAGLKEQVDLEIHRRRGTSHHDAEREEFLHLAGKEI